MKYYYFANTKKNYYHCTQCGSVDLIDPQVVEINNRKALQFTCRICKAKPYWHKTNDICGEEP